MKCSKTAHSSQSGAFGFGDDFGIGETSADPWSEHVFSTTIRPSDSFGDVFSNGNSSSAVSTLSNASTLNQSISSGTEESKRQDCIQELIVTEQNYMGDMKIVKDVSWSNYNMSKKNDEQIELNKVVYFSVLWHRSGILV